MTATILSFADAKLRKKLKRISESQLNSSQKEEQYAAALNNINYVVKYTVQTKEEYQKEYSKFVRSFDSMRPKYKHPTILSDYRKDINPVCALYENLQESLFKYNPDNEYCMWVIDLFRDREWLAILIADLEKDCISINKFQEMHFGTDHKLESLFVLQNIQNNFQDYIYVFSMMQEWEH